MQAHVGDGQVGVVGNGGAGFGLVASNRWNGAMGARPPRSRVPLIAHLGNMAVEVPDIFPKVKTQEYLGQEMMQAARSEGWDIAVSARESEL